MENDFRVGSWLVQPTLNTISQNGTSTRVEPKVMEVLVCLSRHAGEPVTKEELLETVWRDTFVTDDVLKRSVSELRRVFEDDARESRIIETIPKRGYRLLAAVQPVNGHVQGGAGPQPVEIPPQPSRTPSRGWKIGLSAVTIVIPVCALLVALNLAGLRDRLFGRAQVINSLAVLPLQNLSGDPSQDYFADGMTEELITELSHLSSLRVISRTSIMRYKNANKPLPEIARELGVEGIIEGSVLRSGDQVRITAQLIYAPQDKNIWAQSYERNVEDVLALQSAVAGSIANEIRVQMKPAEQAQLGSFRAVNLKAHEAYLQGRYHLQQAQDVLNKKNKGKLNEDEAESAVNWFQQAIQADPNYAPPYIGVSDAWSASQLPPRDWLVRARPMALKALQLDDNLADAHYNMASILGFVDWNWVESEKEFRRAIQLEPSSAAFHSDYSKLLFELGRAQEGMKEAELAQALDPKSERMADAFYLIRQFDRAVELYHSRAHMMPSDFNPHFVLSNIYALTGRQQEAIAEIQKMLTILEYQELAATVGQDYERSGFQQALKAYAKQLEDVYSHTAYIPTWYIASIYALEGDKDSAFAWLERACKARDGVDTLAADPQWDPLRSDPRFKDFLRRVGLSAS